jgi:hypothetical protein
MKQLLILLLIFIAPSLQATATFSSEKVVAPFADGASSVYAIDVDGDDDIDILSASKYDDKIAWYENDGSQNFIPHDVTTSADGAQSVYAIDMDGDGDIDILSASRNDDKIAWYENDGSQNFISHIVTTSADDASSVYAIDMDGDGDIDILSASMRDDKIAWYENDGSQNFTPHIVTTSADSATSVYAIDVDGDGDIDMLSASFNDDKIAWYENDGSQNFTAYDVTNFADMAKSVYAIDVDGDGDIDILSASYADDKIAWYENNGSQKFTAHDVTTSADGARYVYAIDVDGDGDIDMLSASFKDDKIAWYKNDGKQNFTAHDVTTSADGADSVYAIDVDGDGDIDILSASYNDDKITWYENDGSQNFTPHVVTTSTNGADSVYVIDVDGDSDIDMLSASRVDDKIAWYENLNLPNAPTNLTANSASQTQINLSWSDNSTDETGFKVERTGSLITTNAANATNYSDSRLSCGTTYSYSVKATNVNGDSSAATINTSTSSCPPPTYRLLVSKTGNGIINGTGISCGTDCQEDILQNTESTLTATPDEGWLFSAWGSDCSGTNPTITITLDANKTCTPLFEEITCPTTNRLHINKTASGKETGCDWGNGFTDLQKALTEIAAGTFSGVKEIWVTKGTYKPTISTNRSATFQLINGVSIYGGFSGIETQLSERNSSANATILSGDIGIADDNSDNSYHVVTGSGTNNTALLNGFIISGGNANDGETCPNACGGGLFNDNGSPTLQFLFVRDNSAILGGGVMNWNDSRPVIRKTFISENNATDGGGIVNDGSHPVISHVFVKDNTATNIGGGLLNRNNANPLLSHVNLNHNTATTGGGMVNDNSNPVISHSILSANTATNGAGMVNQNLSAPTLSHVIINGNIASQLGGAILNDNSTPLITQSTLSGNSSGIMNRNSRPTVNNSILWNNSIAITDDKNSQTTVNYSIVEGGWAGNGNKADDPLFVEVADATTTHTTVGAFHLTAGSPAIDAGNNDLIPLDLADAECFGGDGNTTEPVDIDFDGRERRFDGNGNGVNIVDMGAYEAIPSLSFYPLTVTITGNGSGTVNSNKAGITCGTDCNQDYLSGTKVLLIAKSDAGSQFAGWIGACSGNEDHVLVEMTEAKSCEAQFDRARVSLDGITLICDDCTINNATLETVEAQPVPPGNYVFPQGFVSFELGDMVNPQAHLSIYFHNINNLGNFVYRKYGPTTPSEPNSANWYNFFNVTIGLDTLDSQTMLKASLTLADGVLGDDTGEDGRIVDAGGIARAIVTTTPSTVVSTTPLCRMSDSHIINTSCSAGGRKFTKEVEVKENTSVARAIFEGDVDNKGMISNSTVGSDATLTGGKLTGKIINKGTIADVNFVGMELSGGTLSGTITNNSKVGGVIKDVKLAAGTTLKGGKLGGEIIGDPDDPPFITAAQIMPGSILSHVRLSPTVKLPENVVLGEGVILPRKPPTLADFGLTPEDIAKLDAETLGNLEPAVFATFTAEDIKTIPPEAFVALKPAQIAEIQKAALEGLTTEQFEQTPIKTLDGLTSENMGGLPIEVLTEFTPEHLNALDVKEFKAMPSEDVSKLFTNLNAEKITPKEAEKLVPPNWQLNLETGALTAPVGAKLSFQSSPSRRYSSSATNSTNSGAFSLPKLPNLKTGFGVGGGGTSLMKNTQRSLAEQDLSNFVLSQDENGILRVEGTGESAGILYTFIPDADNAIQVNTDKIPIGLSTSSGGFYTITTPDGIQYKVIPVPQNPVALSELFGGTEVIIGARGDVLVELPVKTRRGGARQVLIFDAFVEPAPEDICVELDTGEIFCEFDNAPEHVQPGLHLPTDNKRSTRAGEQAKVVYPDGTAQTIRPTVLSPDIFIQEGMKFEGVKRMLFKADGSCYAFYQGNHLWVRPNFEVKTETVETDGAIAPSITSNGKGEVTYRIAIDESTQTRRGGARQILIFDLFIEPTPTELCVELETGETFCEFDNAAEHVQP